MQQISSHVINSWTPLVPTTDARDEGANRIAKGIIAFSEHCCGIFTGWKKAYNVRSLSNKEYQEHPYRMHVLTRIMLAIIQALGLLLIFPLVVRCTHRWTLTPSIPESPHNPIIPPPKHVSHPVTQSPSEETTSPPLNLVSTLEEEMKTQSKKETDKEATKISEEEAKEIVETFPQEEIDGNVTRMKEVMLKIQNISLARFCEGTLDEYIKEQIKIYVKANDKFGLQCISYALFAGKRPILGSQEIQGGYLFYHLLTNDAVSAEDVGEIILEKFVRLKQRLSSIFATSLKHSIKAFSERPLSKVLEPIFVDMPGEKRGKVVMETWERLIPDSLTSEEDLKDEESGYVHLYPTKRQLWGEGQKETMVEITHGGGYLHLLDFLDKRSPGYAWDNGEGFGIYVHPTQVPESRLRFYAEKGFAQSDIPCIFRAKIQAQYLDHTINEYEAGLRAENISHLQDIRFEFPKVKPNFSLCPTFFGSIESSTLRERLKNKLGIKD